MIAKILNSKTKTVAFAAFLLAVSGLISRILGLFRDRLIANRLGAGELSDIYFAAFRVPDFVYGILVAGGITSVFLPILSEYFEKGGDKEKDQWPEQALNLASNVLNCFLFLVVLICGILAILAPVIAKFVVPGFSEENRDLTVALTRIMFLSPVLFGISSIFSVILHYFNKFLCYSLAPILYNLGIIFGILFFFPKFGVLGLGFGVILGALLHLLIQLPAAINSGFNYRLIFNFKHPGIRSIFKLMAPRIVGIAAYNLNLIAIVSIASILVAGSVSVFSYANNLYYLPIGLVGIPFAISSFPILSKLWAGGRKEEFQKSFFSSLRQIIYFVVPVALLLFLLRAQAVRLVLGSGKFGWWETRLVAASLGIFCIGIIAESITPLLSRAFFALKNTKIPAISSLLSFVLSISLALIFTSLLKLGGHFKNFLAIILKLQNGDMVENIEVIGLPMALVVASFFQLIFLSIFFIKKTGKLGMGETLNFIKNILAMSLLAFIFSYIVRQMLGSFVNMDTYFGVLIQSVITVLIGFSVYFFGTLLLKIPEARAFKSAILRKLGETEYESEYESKTN